MAARVRAFAAAVDLEAARGVAQPPSIFARNSGEHWAGRLYVRRASPYLTRLLIPTRITPNAVTWLMIVGRRGAAAVLTVPGCGRRSARCC